MTEARPDTWMPMFWGDYLADTGHLTTEQHGAYLLLIGHYWRRGPLPNDDIQLASITRLAPKAWQKVKAIVLAFFSLVDGLWHHKRIDEEWEAAVERRARAIERGRRGGQAKSKQRQSSRASTDQALEQAETQVQSKSSYQSPPPPDSEPSGSDAAIAAPGDDRAWLFNAGLDALDAATGKTGRYHRSLVAKWLKDSGENVSHIRQLIESATLGPQRPIAPISWIAERLKPRETHGQSEQLRRRTAQLAGLAAAAEELDARELAARENARPGLAALPGPGLARGGVDGGRSGLPEGPAELPDSRGRARH